MPNYLSKVIINGIEALIRDTAAQNLILDLQNKATAEKTARENADNALQNNITAEETARKNADNVLQNNITAEKTARENADNVLQSNITAEETARENSDNTLQSNIDSVSNKVNNLKIINVKDYGAKGDGTTDDLNAFNEAINACPIHGTVYIPIGVYYLSNTLTISKPIILLGSYSGWDVEEKTSNVTNEEYKRPLLISNSSTIAINVTTLGFTMKYIALLCKNPTIECGLKLTNNGETTTFERFVVIDTCTFIHYENSGSGIRIISGGLTRIYNVLCYGWSIGYFISGNVNTSIVLTGCWAENFYGTGYNLSNCAYTSLITCAADTLHSDTGNAYVLNGCSNVRLISCGAEKFLNGFILDTCHNCSVSGEGVADNNTSNIIMLRYGGNIVIEDFTCIDPNNKAIPLYLQDPAINYLLINTNINKISVGGTIKTPTNGGFFDGTKAFGIIS